MIQRFNPKFMLGLTATDQRLDAQKLDEVFGKYDVDLTLVEAIRQNLLSPIKAFRLRPTRGARFSSSQPARCSTRAGTHLATPSS